MRFKNSSYLPAVKKQLQQIADKVYIEGTTTKFSEILEFNAMLRLDESMQLFDFVKAVSAEEGFGELSAKAVGGASDSGYTTAVGIASCCAMGVQGGRNHTDEEFAIVESLFSRAKLLIAILLKINTK